MELSKWASHYVANIKSGVLILAKETCLSVIQGGWSVAKLAKRKLTHHVIASRASGVAISVVKGGG